MPASTSGNQTAATSLSDGNHDDDNGVHISTRSPRDPGRITHRDVGTDREYAPPVLRSSRSTGAVQISLTGSVRALQNHSVAVFPTALEPSESCDLPAIYAKFVERRLGALLKLLPRRKSLVRSWAKVRAISRLPERAGITRS
jgi:hypothetical protein